MKNINASDRARFLDNTVVYTILNDQLGSIDEFPYRTEINRLCKAEGSAEGSDEEVLSISMKLAVAFRNAFEKVLCYVEGELYFRNLQCEYGNKWSKDSNRFSGLKRWFQLFSLDISIKNIRKVVDLCIQFNLIPHMSKDEFDSLVTADILCGPGNFMNYGKSQIRQL